MSIFGLRDDSFRNRMARLFERLSDPAVRDRVINLALGLGVALVIGLAAYMLVNGR